MNTTVTEISESSPHWNHALRICGVRAAPPVHPHRVGRNKEMARPGESPLLRHRAVGEFHASQLRSAAVLTILPGDAGIISLSTESAISPPPDAIQGLISQAQSFGCSEGLQILEILMPRGHGFGGSLSVAGFVHLTDLLYLAREREAGPVGPLGNCDYSWVSKTSENGGLFLEAIAQSYIQTLDCPELTTFRTPAQALAGHEAVGIHDPNLWWVAIRRDQPVGVLLLSRLTNEPALELVYMGVVHSARRTGVGGELLGRCVLQATMDCASLLLAVDQRNQPALQLYLRWGFRAIGAREAWILARPVHEIA